MTQANFTALDEWIREEREDATRNAIEMAVAQITSNQSIISWGHSLNINNLDVVDDAVGAVGYARDTVDLWSTSQNRQQGAEANLKFIDFFLNALSAGGNPLWEGTATFSSTLNDAERTYKAFEHENESQSLVFGGVLSNARLSEIRFASPDFDRFGGSFSSFSAEDRVSVSGNWTAAYGSTLDRFDAFSRYSFKELPTASGHVLTGIGFVSRDRLEQHDPYQYLPMLGWMNVFNSGDPMMVTEKTRRNESYKDSFNGALANQNIQQVAEFNRNPSTSTQFKPATLMLYDQGSLKHPPWIFIPPPSPPRPSPSSLSNGEPVKEAGTLLNLSPAPHRAQVKRPAFPPAGTTHAPSGNNKRGGVSADIKISDSNFAPKKGEQK